MRESLIVKIKKVLFSAVLWSILLFAGVIYIFVFGVDDVSGTVSQEQLELLEKNVRRSSVQCYALEGKYADDLDYLVEEYGLYYDEKNFVVHYENIGSNLLPQISAFYIGPK